MNPGRRRILMAAQRIARVGGAESHLAAAVAVLREAGNEVLLALGETPGDDDHGASEVHVIPGLSDKPAPRGAFARLSALVVTSKPDLVHIQQLPDAGWVAAIAGKAPVVYNIHNHDPVCTSGQKYFRHPGQECGRPHGLGCVPNLLVRGCAHSLDPRGLPGSFRRTTRFLDDLRAADVVVAHSNFMVEELHLNGIQRTVLVPLFITPIMTPSTPPADGPILFAGRITPGKGLGTLLKAATRVDASVEVVGDGWWMSTARRLARTQGVEDRVSFRGWLGPGEMEEAFRSSRVVAVPSHWPEPFGLVGLEAMAVGRPVVASDVGGISDWLEHKGNGLKVRAGNSGSLADALAAILSNPDRGARMGRQGTERVRRDFTSSNYLIGLENAYSDAEGRRPAGWRGS